MRKILVTFSAVFALLLCLAIGLSAQDIYSDYTKEGINGEDPLFTFLGYSIDKESNDICVNYNVDIDAVNAYEKQIGKTISYGVVVAYNGNANGTTPLDSKGNPTGANADKVVTVKLARNVAILSVVLTGIEEENLADKFLLCLYVVEEEGVKYVAETTTETSPDPVSFEKIRGPVEYVIKEGGDTIVFSYEKPESTIEKIEKRIIKAVRNKSKYFDFKWSVKIKPMED